jgi:hypothetical protein
MLKVIQCFGKHYSCHLQGEYLLIRRFWKPNIGQALGGEWDVADMIIPSAGHIFMAAFEARVIDSSSMKPKC